MKKPRDPTVRFWTMVEKTPSGCWLWTASKTSGGYGRFCPGSPSKKQWVVAHRFSYEQEFGPIPEGMEIHHRCETPACVNPGHLIAVSHRNHNVLLTPHSLAAQNAAKTHCAHGHRLTPENVYVWPKRPTERHCKTCRRYRMRIWNATCNPLGFGRRNHPYFPCVHCGRMIRGKANLLKHESACLRKAAQ
jgi:hypothetical protein